MRGSASISVTLVPKAWKISANSIPTAPAPMIASDAGAFSRNSASSEEMTVVRSEEHTSELQSRENLVCRLLLEKKKLAPVIMLHHPHTTLFILYTSVRQVKRVQRI